MLWLSPGQWHSYAPNSRTGWTEYYIGFKGDVINNLIGHSFLEGKNCAFNLGYSEELASLYMRALEVARKKGACYQSYLSGIVLHMLGLVMAQMKEGMERSCKNDQRVEQAKIVMKENIKTDLDMQQLSSSLGISYSYFRKIFKESTGVAPSRYFLELKIEKAKQLLASTDLPIKECIYFLGYDNRENFCNVFKKNTGYTLVEYRRMSFEKRQAG